MDICPISGLTPLPRSPNFITLAEFLEMLFLSFQLFRCMERAFFADSFGTSLWESSHAVVELD